MRNGAFVIPVQHLSEDDNIFDLSAPLSVLGEINLNGSVSVHATVKKMEDRLLLHCDIDVSGTYSCDRCLDEYNGGFQTSYEQWYELGGREMEYADEDVIPIPREARHIVIDEDLREAVLAGKPVKFLCSDGCKGICTECGKNRNHEICTCSDPAGKLGLIEFAQL